MELLIAAGILVAYGLVLFALTLGLPAISAAASERARIEREAQAASWRIHQQATQAFAQMLEAARRSSADPSQEQT